ncbi:DUF4126 family protein [Parvularcula flava]|uniref:DUF4126 domain-containing protein n=1 Tax=Aquisalinus luteolus TaxID=1566827 RepID=A0A8J3EV87_9PROT|nr:DUF4126 family protein [Aquisalinus luteolus]NHK28854.1 DUF4126 family protein [Aquisalinus luteolus]GGH99719.1 DUF4126 domain-containing protein [Aquisalinus luteolus]
MTLIVLISCAALLGIAAGARTFTPPVLVSWAAVIGWLPLEGTALGFLGTWWAVVPLTGLALFELVGDKLPSAPSRLQKGALIARIVSGALTGAALGIALSLIFVGLIAGAFGAFAGTYLCHGGRATCASLFGKDLPAALLEDALAITVACATIWIASGFA